MKNLNTYQGDDIMQETTIFSFFAGEKYFIELHGGKYFSDVQVVDVREDGIVLDNGICLPTDSILCFGKVLDIMNAARNNTSSDNTDTESNKGIQSTDSTHKFKI